MLSEEELKKYLLSVPAVPKIIKSCKEALLEGDLSKAAEISKEDKAFIYYLQNIVNKPIFGFRTNLSEPKQIFSALGLSRAIDLVNSYLFYLLAPKKWEFFDLNNAKFFQMQSEFIKRWEIILDAENITNKDIRAVAVLIPAIVVVCENIFKDYKDDIELIKKHGNFTYDEILYKLSGYKVFQLVLVIAKKWNFSTNIVNIFELLLKGEQTNSKLKEVMDFLALLISYQISRPTCLLTGINSLFHIKVNASEKVTEKFYSLMKDV